MIHRLQRILNWVLNKSVRDMVRQERFLIQLVGLLVICTGLATFSATAQSMSVTTQTVVSEHWRGAYDLLIRPPSAISQMELETGLVEGNYLGTPRGGITREQLDLIRSISDVEVAAPVSTIGYLLNSTGGINLSIPIPQPGTVYKLEYVLKDQLGNLVAAQTGFVAVGVEYQSNPGMFATYGSTGGSRGPRGELFNTIGQLPVMWTLVVGIDPVAEAALTGLDQAVSGEFLPQGQDLEQTIRVAFDHQKASKIPIIISSQSFLDQTLQVNIESLDLSTEELDWQQLISPESEAAYQNAWGTIFSFFAAGQPVVHQDVHLNLKDWVQPLSQQNLTFYPEQGMEISDSGYLQVTNTNVLLYPAPYAYQEIQSPDSNREGLVLALESKGTWGEAVAPFIREAQPEMFLQQPVDVPPKSNVFRQMRVYSPPPFVLDVKGRYDFEKLIIPDDPLSYVPMGIYEPPYAALLYDEQYQPLELVRLTPDLNPAGFIPRPPLGLTNLEGAHYLLEREDFIDAIRVRLSGIEEYTPENLAKVERIASEITERTQLHVDIVAGSSPQKVLVLVPGVGYVEENWTTLGAAKSITGGVNTANILLLGIFYVAAILFITHSVQLNMQAQREEIGLIKAFGWKPKEMVLNLMGELFLFGGIGMVLSFVAGWALTWSLGIIPDLKILALTATLAPLLYILGGIVPIRAMVRRLPVENLNPEIESEKSVHHRNPVGGMNMIRLAFRQLSRRRIRFVLTLILILAGATLSSLVINILVNLQGILKITFLGNYVALVIEQFHILMVLVAILMSGLVVLENLYLSVLERKREIGLLKAFGWSRFQIFMEIILEGVLLGLIGGGLGALAGLSIIGVIMQTLNWTDGLVALVVWLGMCLWGGLCAFYPAWQASRFNPQEIISYSGMGIQKVKPQISSWKILGVGILGALLLGSIFLLGRQSPVVKETVGGDRIPRQAVELPDYGISMENMMDHIQKIAGNGSRVDRNQAETQAAAYLVSTFQKYGFSVHTEAVATNSVTIHDGEASLVLKAEGGFYHETQLVPDGVVAGEFYFQTLDESLPPMDILRDRILLMEMPGSDPEFFKNTAISIVEHGIQDAVRAVVFIKPNPVEREALIAHASGSAIASIPVGETIVATLPGTGQPDQEIWIATHYDTNSNSPGANDGASGAAVALELARLLADQPPAMTVRIILFTQTAAGYEGVITYVNSHAGDVDRMAGVIYLDDLGAWSTLAVSNSLTLGDDSGEISPELRRQLQEEGRFHLRNHWFIRINLDQPDLQDWLNTMQTRKMGIAETPNQIMITLVDTAARLGIPVQIRAHPCMNQSPLLAGGFPTVAICGQGNDLVGTPFDDSANIDRNFLYKAATLAYASLQAFLGEIK